MGGSPHSAATLTAPGRDEAITGVVGELRRRFGSNVLFLAARLETTVRRTLGIPLVSPAAQPVTALTGLVLRLTPPLLVTAVTARWAGAPWWRWLVVAVNAVAYALAYRAWRRDARVQA